MTGINTKQIFVNHLSYGKTFFIVNTQVDGVVLPDHLMAESEVKLSLSKDFDTTVFEMDATKIKVDLAFGDKKFLCTIPFNSIYYIAMAHSPFDGVQIDENAPKQTLELVQTLAKVLQSTFAKPRKSNSKAATINTEEELVKQKNRESFQRAVAKSFEKVLNDLDEGRFDMDKIACDAIFEEELNSEKEIDLSAVLLKNETRH